MATMQQNKCLYSTTQMFRWLVASLSLPKSFTQLLIHNIFNPGLPVCYNYQGQIVRSENIEIS